jgi:aspartate racemase
MEDASIVIDRLQQRSGVEVLVPAAADRAKVHAIIYDELCRGVVSDASRLALLGVIDRLAARGAQGAILGCTEIMLLLDPAQHGFPMFDSTTLHAEAAVTWMLSGI